MNAITLPESAVAVPPEGLTIGDVAHATGLSVETLRYYEREGLMLDPTRRDVSGRRRYGANDLAWIGGLLMLRETGMSIAGMRELAELSREAGTEAERLRALEAHRADVIAQLERTRKHLAALDEKITAYRRVVASGDARGEKTDA